MMSAEHLVLAWLLGCMLLVIVLLVWAWTHPRVDQVLGFFGLIVWLVACVALAILLAEWWIPSS